MIHEASDLGNDDVQSLLIKVKSGSREASAELCERYRPLLYALSRRVSSYHYPLLGQDLFQAGCIGLLQAANGFDFSYGVRFVTYAVPWVLGEMKRTMRLELDAWGAGTDWRTVLSGEQRLLEGDREKRLSHMMGEPQDCEGIEDADLQNDRRQRPLSLDDNRVGQLAATIAGEESVLEEIDLRNALEHLDKFERQVILIRYYRDRTQKEAARMFGKSQSCISKAEQRALKKLRSALHHA